MNWLKACCLTRKSEKELRHSKMGTRVFLIEEEVFDEIVPKVEMRLVLGAQFSELEALIRQFCV